MNEKQKADAQREREKERRHELASIALLGLLCGGYGFAHADLATHAYYIADSMLVKGKQ